MGIQGFLKLYVIMPALNQRLLQAMPVQGLAGWGTGLDQIIPGMRCALTAIGIWLMPPGQAVILLITQMNL